MSGGQNNNEKRSYGAEDIRRYLGGEMSPVEMHAFEQASQDDPMLGDALEGMREVKADTREDLAGLQRRISERTVERKRVVPLWRSAAKVAAAGIVMIGLATLARYFIAGSSQSKDIALSAEKAKPAVVVNPPADTTPEAKTDPVPAKELAFEKEEHRAVVVKASRKKEPVPPEARISSAAPARPAESESISDSAQSAVASSGYAARVENDKSALDSSRVNHELESRVAGVVVSRGANQKLSSADTPASTSLNEVVVTGFGSGKRQRSLPPVPAPGWEAYQNYLDANKFHPAIDSSLHGTEIVTFTVTKKGRPVEFVVGQSVSPEHDSLVIRLIREGPKWKPAKDPTRRMSVNLKY